MIQQAVGMLQQALPGLQTGTPLHQDVLKGITRLSKHIPAGAPGAGVQQTQLQDLLKNVVKNAILSRIMGQQQQRGGPGGTPGGPGQPAGGNPVPGVVSQGGGEAPMPSTPLPGS
jgi:hypothetical protein